ncbi:hypothetical protein [Archangium sp.]|uniref:hypothetical protein n=1 Tax=Archangium sp. TaxID=1872627 RepID=UPI002EDA5E08
MFVHKLKLATLAFAVLAQAACGGAEPSGAEPVPGAEEAQAQSGLEFEPIAFITCDDVAPNAVLYVGNGYSIPFTALPYSSKSGNGAYYYKGCGRYVVDIYVGDTKPPLPSPSYLLKFTPAAHDLPSSTSVGGELPGNAIDCAAYRQSQIFYKKNASNTWDSLGYSSMKGVWNGTSCSLQTTSGTKPYLEYIENTADNGWAIYRVAVAVKLRSSGQEAKVTVSEDFIIN